MTSKNVTRVDLAEVVHQKVGLSRTGAVFLVEAVLREITDSLSAGASVKLSSFGSFVVSSKHERIGRNPKTGVEVTISPRRVVVFKPSGIIKRQVNGKGSEARTPEAKRGSSARPAKSSPTD